MGHWTND